MALVQLIDLSEMTENISEFRLFTCPDIPLSQGFSAITGPDGLQVGVGGLDKYKWEVSKRDFPKNNSELGKWQTGLAVRIVLVVVWDESGIAKGYKQPDEKFWVIHPADGSILAVSSSVSVLREEVKGFLGGTSVI